MSDPLFCLVGPTASGKTGIGILLAERLDGEIISADSRQVYRGMNIGTAKPTAEELGRVPHHLIDVADPDELYHSARFVGEAESAIEQIRGRGRTPIVVGGTGLYLRALIRGLDVEVGRHPEIRRDLEKRIEEEGLAPLHLELTRVDPESAARIHRNDRTRIIRALEIFLVTGEKQSDRHRIESAPRQTGRIAGLFPPRPVLNRRIEDRFDRMIEAGFLEEVQTLLDRGYDPDLPAFRSPGYREMIAHLRDRITLEEAIEKAKSETRRYGKRQVTWFRSEDLFRVDPTGSGTADAVDRIAVWYGSDLPAP